MKRQSAALPAFSLAAAVVVLSHLSMGPIGSLGSLRANAESADLQVQVFAFPDPAPTNADLTYLLVLSNFGPDEASNVVVTDTLPPGVVFKGADEPCTFDGASTVSCVFSTVGVTFDEGIPLQITVTTPGSPATLVNNVSVSSDTSDTDATNNTASVSTDMQVSNVSDLSVSASAAPNPGITGRLLTFRTTVSNLGPQHAAGVLLRNHSSFGADVSAITPSQGTCALVDEAIECDLGPLAANGTATLDFSAKPLVAGPVFNVAFVTGYGDPLFLDPDSSNDANVFSVNVKTPGKSNPALTTTSNQEIAISQTIFNPCSGEHVALEGTVRTVMHSTGNSNHFSLQLLTNGRNLTGVGLTSGATYRGASITGSNLHQPRTTFPLTQSFGQTLHLTDSAGGVLRLHTNFRLRIDENGVASLVVDNLTFNCGHPSP